MSKEAPDKFLILSIIAAALIVAGAVVYAVNAKTGGAPPPPGAPGTAKSFNEQVVVGEAMASCAAGESCIVVDTTCSFCCKYLAINAKHEKTFNEMFDRNCAAYGGTMCECFDLGSYPACVDGKCRLKKWDDDKTTK